MTEDDKQADQRAADSEQRQLQNYLAYYRHTIKALEDTAAVLRGWEPSAGSHGPMGPASVAAELAVMNSKIPMAAMIRTAPHRG